MPSVQDIYVQRAGDSYPAHWLYMSCNQIIVALQTGEEDTIFIFLFLFLLLSLKPVSYTHLTLPTIVRG